MNVPRSPGVLLPVKIGLVEGTRRVVNDLNTYVARNDKNKLMEMLGLGTVQTLLWTFANALERHNKAHQSQ